MSSVAGFEVVARAVSMPLVARLPVKLVCGFRLSGCALTEWVAGALRSNY